MIKLDTKKLAEVFREARCSHGPTDDYGNPLMAHYCPDCIAGVIATAHNYGAEAMRDVCVDAARNLGREAANWWLEKQPDAPASAESHALEAELAWRVVAIMRTSKLPEIK